WTLLEWWRGWVLTGFPWNLVGYSWAFSDAMNQFAALTGIWGLSLVTVIAAAMPAMLVDWAGRTSGAAAPPRRPAALGCIAVSLALLVAIWIGGSVRLAGAHDSMVAGVRLRLVQANVEPGEKASGDRGADVLRRHLSLTRETPGYDKVTDVVWSETAEPYPLERFPDVRLAVAAVAPENGPLNTGGLRTDSASGPVNEV